MRPLLARIVHAIRTSPALGVWVRPALRLLLVLVGLVVLAGIGRSVTAIAAVGGQVPPAAASSSSLAPVDAGASAADASPPPPRSPPPTPSASAAVVHSLRATPDDPVYLNEATSDDLRRLPGIGDKRAQAILELRTKLGKFRQIEELMRVKGIGRATLKKLRPLLRLERPDGGP